MVGKRLVRVGLLAASAILAAIACGADHPWWFTAGTSSCFSPISIRLHGSVRSLGGCAGSLGPPETIRLSTGDHLDLHVGRIAIGTLAVPIPTSDQPVVVRIVKRDSDGSTVTYQAEKAGVANLSTDTDCPGAPNQVSSQARCPIFHVVVTKSG
jgi:hypothetical protein